MKLTQKRRQRDRFFRQLCFISTLSALVILGILVYHIVHQGWSWLSWDFLTNFQSRFPHKSGVKAAIVGTLWMMSMTAIMSVPLGILTAIYLEEYAPRNRITNWIVINIGNLAGMPSIVYGLIGLAIFVRYLGMGRSLWAGSLTLSLLTLPVIIIVSQESIKAVPNSLREAAYALGVRQWQVVFSQVLPAALPGIMTGVILSVSRAVGETAPLLVVGALSYVAFLPEGPSDEFTVLPVQIFDWASRPREEFHYLAAAGIIVLLVMLFLMNLGAILIRQKYQRYKL